MSRGLWFVAGAGAGVYAMTRARRVAEAFTADGLRDRLHALDVGARMFRDEVAAARGEREPELRRRLGLAAADPGTPVLDPVDPAPVDPGPAATPAAGDQHEKGSH